jgi:hypothetical protein
MAMRLMADFTLEYPGYFGCESRCRVRLFEGAAHEPYLALYEELEENPGTSVTNACEEVCRRIWQYLERPGRGVAFVERYPDRCYLGGRPVFREHFDRVEFAPAPFARRDEFRHPRWKRTSREEVERTIGTPLGP